VESGIASDECHGTPQASPVQTRLLRAEAQLRSERARRNHLEHLLREELAQELAGIALLVTALRRQARSALEADQALQQIADLLASSIGHCCRAAPTPLRTTR